MQMNALFDDEAAWPLAQFHCLIVVDVVSSGTSAACVALVYSQYCQIQPATRFDAL
jgi:hypothetical protein